MCWRSTGLWRVRCASCGLSRRFRASARGGRGPRFGWLGDLVHNRVRGAGWRCAVVVDRNKVRFQGCCRRGGQRNAVRATGLVLGLIGPPRTARSTLHELIFGIRGRFWLIADEFVDRRQCRRGYGSRSAREAERALERLFDTIDHEFCDQRKRLVRDTRRRRHEWWKHSGQVNSPNSLCPAEGRTAQGPPPPAPARRRAELSR